MSCALKRKGHAHLQCQEMESECNHVNYYLSDKQLTSFKYKLCHFILYYFGKFCRTERNNVQSQLHQGVGNNAQDQRPKAKLRDFWPEIVLFVYVLLEIKHFYYMYLKFDYDACSFRLDHWRKSVASQSNGMSHNSSVSELLSACSNLNLIYATKVNKSFVCNCNLITEYAGKAEAARNRLKLIGDPFIEGRFFVQFIWFFVSYTTFFAYVCTQAYYKYIANHEYFLVRLILEETQDYNSCRAIIQRELERVANSSKSFIRWNIQMARTMQPEPGVLHNLLTDLLRSSDISVRISNLPRRARLMRYYQDHRQLMRQLEKLLESNSLHPINRASPEWRDKLVSQYLTGTIMFSIYGLLINLCVVYFCHRLANYQLDFETIADKLHPVEYFLYFWIVIIASTYHAVLFYTDCSNQTHYIEWITQQMVQLVQDNERDFGNLTKKMNSIDINASRQTNQTIIERRLCAAYSDRLNSAVIGVYLQYRIFVAQLNQVKEAWPLAALFALSLMLAVPFLARIYIPYIDEATASLLLLSFLIWLVLFVNLDLAPLCVFERRGHKLYNSMSSLLAHCICLQLQSRRILPPLEGGNCNPGIYMDHTIALIERELDDSAHFVGQFATDSFGFPVNFPNLVKLHFYYSLIILSLFCEISSWRNLLGDRLKDPLGLLKE